MNPFSSTGSKLAVFVHSTKVASFFPSKRPRGSYNSFISSLHVCNLHHVILHSETNKTLIILFYEKAILCSASNADVCSINLSGIG